jgi:hypothetical protein
MATFNLSETRSKIIAVIGREYAQRVAETVGSRSIATSLTTVQTDDITEIRTPYYWALAYHNGRGPITMPKGHYMVWFKDPLLDPRLSGGRPFRRASLRRLTPGEFKEAKKAGLLIISRQVGPEPGTFFFPRAARRFRQAIKGVLRIQMDIAVKSIFDEWKDEMGGDILIPV